MSVHRLSQTLALGLLLATPLGAHAGEPIVPSWITNDPANKAVTIDLVAGWNGNDRFGNYNGYYKDGMTVLVPRGWTVTIDFRNQDPRTPHSVLVTQPYAQEEMELRLTEQDAAIEGAFSENPTEGHKPGEGDRIRFTADEPGRYLLSCGVIVHLVEGMHVGLEVKDGLDKAMVVVNENKIATLDPQQRLGPERP